MDKLKVSEKIFAASGRISLMVMFRYLENEVR